jgi:hypothetical protein
MKTANIAIKERQENVKLWRCYVAAALELHQDACSVVPQEWAAMLQCYPLL